MEKIIRLLLLSSLFCSASFSGIKTAAYWTCPIMSMKQAETLSKYDLAIVDLENMRNNRQALARMKVLNPEVKLICYSNPIEIFSSAMSRRSLQNEWSELLNKHYPFWLLETDRGNSAVFYPGMRLVNISSACPQVKGQNYGDWMASFLLQNVLSDTIWDGYFMDNGGGNISWTRDGKSAKIDIFNSSMAVVDPLTDESWSEGVHNFLKKIRMAKGKKFIILANKGSVEFMDVLDGRMFEGFPCDYLGDDKRDGGWWQSMKNAVRTGKYTIFQAGKDSEFVLASALLIDAYTAVGQDNENYPADLFQDELGQAIGRMEILVGGICQRRFQNGYVTVIPSRREGKITLY